MGYISIMRHLVARLAVGATILASSDSHGAVVEVRLTRWEVTQGGDGRLYGLAIADAEWSWRDARAAAIAAGGDLAATGSPAALEFVASIATGVGAFDCAGPWLGGQRPAGASWTWIDGTAFVPHGWQPGRPAQASLLDSALCLSGEGAADGGWFDALPSPDTGMRTRSAIFVWDTVTDCNRNGIPDKLEILLDAALDGDANGAIDGCGTPNPADLNGDGRVTGADLGLLLANFNAPGPVGDLNRDGIVNGADLGLLLAAWTG